MNDTHLKTRKCFGLNWKPARKEARARGSIHKEGGTATTKINRSSRLRTSPNAPLGRELAPALNIASFIPKYKKRAKKNTCSNFTRVIFFGAGHFILVVGGVGAAVTAAAAVPAVVGVADLDGNQARLGDVLDEAVLSVGSPAILFLRTFY